MSHPAPPLPLDHLPFGIEVFDAEGRRLHLNRLRAKLQGYSDTEFAPLTPMDWLDDHGRNQLKELWQMAERGDPGSIQVASSSKEGEPQTLEIIANPVQTKSGDTRVVLITRDVTAVADERRAHSDLRRHHNLILDSAGEGIYGLDNQGRTTFVNREAARLTGYSVEELMGRYNHDMVHHSHADGTPYPREHCPIYKAFKDGAVHTVDSEVFWRKDGTSFAVEYTSTPIMDGAGRPVGAVVAFRDISKRRENEAQLKAALAENQRLRKQLQDENIYLREELKLNHRCDRIIGDSTAVKRALFRMEQVAGTDTTVLITGETGTGKELFATAVHNLSARGHKPLIKVNCAAVPETLFESELFGHEKGAFTGASRTKIGRFELANGGTLFLDEIGEMPLALQAKLLRALQEGEIERVGGGRPIKVDVRIIAATNRDLGREAAAGNFRSDLYYRLNVVPINVPPLREREGDIPLLAMTFAERFARQFQKDIRRINRNCLKHMQRYTWPGNIRELQNIIERAVILSQGETLVIEGLGETPAIPGDAATSIRMEDVERAHIIKVLNTHNWVVHGKGRAAEALGINPSTLRSRMKKLGINRPKIHSPD